MDDQIVCLCVDSFHTDPYDNDDYDDYDDYDDDDYVDRAARYGQALILIEKLNTRL